MLIDDFLPRYDVREQHRTLVRAPVETVYAAVRQLDMSEARLSMLLMRLRGIPTGRTAPSCFTLDDFLKTGFILLGERANEELLLGLVGRFWTPSGELRRLDAQGFQSFDEPDHAKAAWNFTLTRQPDASVLLETETRVACNGDSARRRFRFYWLFIKPLSGLIRREILRTVKRRAEQNDVLAKR